MRRRYFAVVRGTPLDEDDARHAFIAERVEGVSSLAEAVDILPQAKFDTIISDAVDYVREWRAEQAKQEQLSTHRGWHDTVTGRDAKNFVAMIRDVGLQREEIYPFVSMVISRHVHDRAQITSEDVHKVLSETGELTDDGVWTFDKQQADIQLFLFDGWQLNEGAAGVLE